jgi:hypothetical protein
VDSNEIIFGLGAEPDGLTSNEVRRLVADVSAVANVVGLTIAEFYTVSGHPRAAGVAQLPAHLKSLQGSRECQRGAHIGRPLPEKSKRKFPLKRVFLV